MDMMFHDLVITDADFQRLVQFIHKNYGIDLSKKRQLITSRLSHSLKARGYPDFKSFLEHLFTSKDPQDLELVLNKLTTNYTYFLREKDHFTFFRNTILPELEQRHRRDKVLSIWSAGCSSGEEPYTLSIYLKEYFGPHAGEWDTRILATDISQQAMAKAKAGIYQPPADMPPEWLRRYFVPSKATPGEYAVAPDIRNNVIFRTFNLMDPIQFKLKFDVIFCRNVMIYFDQSTRDALVRRFYDAMTPNAYLFISHSESLGQTPLFRMVAPAVYRKNSAPSRPQEGAKQTHVTSAT